ncbi:unnamed protein product, partial [Scytosiphon promiscuus]
GRALGCQDIGSGFVVRGGWSTRGAGEIANGGLGLDAQYNHHILCVWRRKPNRFDLWAVVICLVSSRHPLFDRLLSHEEGTTACRSRCACLLVFPLGASSKAQGDLGKQEAG